PLPRGLPALGVLPLDRLRSAAQTQSILLRHQLGGPRLQVGLGAPRFPGSRIDSRHVSSSVVRGPWPVVGLPPLVPSTASPDRPHIHQPAPISASANNGQRTTDQGQETQCSRGSVAAMIALTACWLKPL